MSARAVGHAPLVHLCSVVIHHMDNTGAREGGEECITWANGGVVDASEAETSTV